MPLLFRYSQSLSEAVSKELRRYLRLIATLEGQFHETSAESRLTLKRIFVWTRDAQANLLLLAGRLFL